MCGIAGYSHATPTTIAMLPFLAWEMEDRGPQSWGMTNGELIIKRLGAVTSNWETPPWDGPTILHTRQASTGAVTLENQHPFCFYNSVDGGPEDQPSSLIIGIHNGCLTNHEELNKKYSRSFTCDSQHIFANIAEGRPTEDIKGWGACAYFRCGKLRLLRFNHEALKIVLLETGELVFASTLEPLKRAATMVGSKVKEVLSTKEAIEYTVEVEDGIAKLVEGIARPFGRTASYATGVYTPSWRGRQMAGGSVAEIGKTVRDAGLCAMFFCGTKVDRRKATICGNCKEQLTNSYQRSNYGTSGWINGNTCQSAEAGC